MEKEGLADERDAWGRLLPMHGRVLPESFPRPKHGVRCADELLKDPDEAITPAQRSSTSDSEVLGRSPTSTANSLFDETSQSSVEAGRKAGEEA